MTLREQLLLCLAPAALAVTLYVGFWSRDAELAAIEAELQTAPPLASSSAVRLPLLREETERLRAERRQLVARANQGTRHEDPALEHQVLRLLARHGLGVATTDLPANRELPPSLGGPLQRCAELSGQGTAIPSTPAAIEYDEALNRITPTIPSARAPTSGLPLRVFDFRGSYLATLAALEELQTLCVPVSLDLDAAPGDEGAPRWQLVLLPAGGP